MRSLRRWPLREHEEPKLSQAVGAQITCTTVCGKQDGLVLVWLLLELTMIQRHSALLLAQSFEKSHRKLAPKVITAFLHNDYQRQLAKKTNKSCPNIIKENLPPKLSMSGRGCGNGPPSCRRAFPPACTRVRSGSSGPPRNWVALVRTSGRSNWTSHSPSSAHES